LEPEVLFHVILNIQYEASKFDLAKTWLYDSNVILTRFDAREDINSSVIRSRLANGAALDTLKFHFGSGDNGAISIGYSPRDRCALRLGNDSKGEAKKRNQNKK